VTFIDHGNYTTDPIPPLSQMYRWGAWFPAVTMNIGSPVGSRNLRWKRATDITTVSDCDRLTCADVWRRDFTKAVVLVRPYCGGGCNDGELDAPSKPMCINSADVYPACTGGPWYPLQADGSLASGITSIQLRAAEGAILMTSETAQIPGT